ncbi:MAG: hypothetical protein ACYTEL_17125 [Planctomycetota bacterium]|jgi:cell shape-determining protein MreD
MRWLRFSVLVVFVTVVQASLLDRIAVSSLSIKPDLLLILLVFFALYGVPRSSQKRRAADFDISEAIISSFVIGFFADVIGPSMGPRMISFGILGTVMAQLFRVISLGRMFYQGGAIVLTGVLAGILIHFLTFLKGQPSTALVVVGWTSLYSAVIGPFLFLPGAWWMGIKAVRKGRR